MTTSPADGDGQLSLLLPSPVPSPAPVKGHSLPACDACRLCKRRCSLTAGAEGRTHATGTALATTTTSPPPPSSLGKCFNCERAGSRCTFLLPLRARGPKPGRKTVPAHHQIAAWQVDAHESKTDTAISTRGYATDILFPRELVLLVLGDYVTSKRYENPVDCFVLVPNCYEIYLSQKCDEIVFDMGQSANIRRS
ncbi:uncharacterized protein B0I36DRAFT_356879 [Microdochium trichocladiopsis]|uniref:Zn(2)-C6 fungal-type domain-containing protein n=1 Tax=Microdochium trichocladiopsis TaxID=1682393 RepID=A0A9P8XP26_9PEZI|nr:uncharacterized protein B0I36DRAFT_356879 [Microdochium trichocladiopsis]KAH7007934.1 hypothetical protein B0I36DRAFT_356879 [Microdochium trichocladiopsis]